MKVNEDTSKDDQSAKQKYICHKVRAFVGIEIITNVTHVYTPAQNIVYTEEDCSVGRGMYACIYDTCQLG